MSAWELVCRDPKHGTWALITPSGVQLSVWAGEADVEELQALRAQLERGSRCACGESRLHGDYCANENCRAPRR